MKNFKKFEFIEHVSDLQFVSYGETLNELFENCAYAMFEGMTDEKIKENFTKNGILKEQNLTYLLHDFLSELLFIFETEHLIFKKFIVNINVENNNYVLEWTAIGDKSENYRIDIGIKGVTYHGLSIEQKKINEKKIWVANVLCDI